VGFLAGQHRAARQVLVVEVLGFQARLVLPVCAQNPKLRHAKIQVAGAQVIDIDPGGAIGDLLQALQLAGEVDRHRHAAAALLGRVTPGVAAHHGDRTGPAAAEGQQVAFVFQERDALVRGVQARLGAEGVIQGDGRVESGPVLEVKRDDDAQDAAHGIIDHL
jgi:hypothetical protein